jgi:hypothetical protein
MQNRSIRCRHREAKTIGLAEMQIRLLNDFGPLKNLDRKKADT